MSGILSTIFCSNRQQHRSRSEETCGSGSTLSLRILTHNIRYATESPSKNEKRWKDRLPHILNQLRYHTRYLDRFSNSESGASFICLQEVLDGQLHDILRGLNGTDHVTIHSSANGSRWGYIGVGRDDGKSDGEYNPILYPTQVLDLLHFETTWLSPTPDKPSKGWGAGSKRILTTGVFEHKSSKLRFAMFSTHLDNESSEAREKAVGVILKVIERVRQKWAAANTSETPPELNEHGLSYVLAGDFNSFPTQEAYKAVKASNTMVDAYDAVGAEFRYGDENTFTGFQPDTDVDRDEIGRIDYIWLGPKPENRANDDQIGDGWNIKGYSVLPNVFEDGVFCSDHRCVVCDAELVGQ